MSRPARLGGAYLVLFATLYAVQGVVVAYLLNFNKPYMKQAGLREDAIGDVQTLALLPMVLKFLVGPLSDRVNLFGLGHRRPFIVLGLLMQAAGLIGLALVDPFRHLSAFAALAVLAVTGLAFYDTCCDGMVVDVTPPEARARVQGLLWTSRFLAATVFTLGFGAWLGWLGGAGRAGHLLWASAALTAAPALLALLLREPPRAADVEVFQWSALGVMVRRRSLYLLAFGGLYGLAGMGVESNLSLYYGRLGFDGGGDVGVLGACRNFGRAAGALLLPLALSRIGRRAVLTVGVLGLATAISGQTLIGSRPEAGAFGFLFGAASGWDDALFAFLAMEAADPRMAASTFALFMAVTNLSVVGDALFARGVTGFAQYRLPFLAAAVVVLVAWPFTWPLSRPPASREHEDAPGA
ncbi:MAG: MFS transporter [Isosphaeraceae bacterium]|nr:MFS transporter [Isosphaeraceae bacterium]